ncbi:PREDICTED: uncharacterized protein LOC108766498 [Trachymyrmex cornetzi]|uniref:uncharacterized protein LOC108766498 n=1 Tax=Trachymyrmex cornetzi TaxID=471704 RepID=UPI00084EE5EC|nr:PREDICTED: uncharacterized protein LOC108766498 [Trachymyrmex cornetzi]
MLPYQFDDLLQKIEPFLPRGGLRRPLPSELKLALTLNFLAHGDSARSKSWEFRIGRSTVYKIVQEFPNCIDALDGKHIRIKASPNSGSKYFCYKKFFSIVLMAICNHKYRFLWVDIGQFGSISDGVWSETGLGRCVGQGSFNIPPPCELPGTNIKINHVLVADEAFPLGMNLLKPYSQKFLANGGEDADKARVFNYHLSRARRIIENAFGILASRWQILLKGCNFYPENVDHIIKALICLHNFIMDDETQKPACTRLYCPPNFIDRENENHEIMEGAWRGLGDNSTLYKDLVNMKGNSGTNAAKAQRNVFREYFVSEAGCNQVPWQFQSALRGYCINI